MNNERSILISILLIINLFSSCIQDKSVLYKFRKDPLLSDEKGKPLNNEISYFPLELFIDSVKHYEGYEVKLDTFRVNLYSRYLITFEEPILYNRYLNKEIYRLTWFRSFDPKIVIRLEKQGNKINLIEKKLIEYKSELALDANLYTEVIDSVKIEESIRDVTKEEFHNFNKLLNDNDFHSMPTTVAWAWGTDGSDWILEKHSKNGYFVVNRWSPDENRYAGFRKICDFLIENSGFQKERKY